MFVKGEISGTRRVQYTSRDGNPRSGWEIHVQYEDQRISGLGCLNFYASDNSLSGVVPSVGEPIVFHWDPRNRRAELVPSAG